MEGETLGLSEEFSKQVGKNLVESLAMAGEIELVHLRGGKVIDQRTIKNTITDAGRGKVSGLINGAVANVFKYIGIGTGTTASAASDTALQTEITTGGGARALATTLDQVTTTVTNDTARAILTFSFTSSFAVTEAGLFDAVSSGNLLARQVFSAVNVVNGDSLQITWKIKQA